MQMMETHRDSIRSVGSEEEYLRNYAASEVGSQVQVPIYGTTNKNLFASSSFSPLSPFIPYAKPTFTTFAPKNSSSTFNTFKSLNKINSFKDDSNPYQVSNIDELQIKVQDPYNVKFSSLSRNKQWNKPKEVVPISDAHFQFPPLSPTKPFPDAVDDEENQYSEPLPPPLSPPPMSPPPPNPEEGEYSELTDLTDGTNIELLPLPNLELLNSETENSSEENLPIPENVNDEEIYENCSTVSSKGNEYGGSMISNLSTKTNKSESDKISSVTSATSVFSEELPLEIPPPICENETIKVEEISKPEPEISKQNDHKNKKINEKEKKKIELSLSGLKTEVFVAESLANLYLKNKPARANNSSGSTSSNDSIVDWTLLRSGVPAVVLDLGEAKGREKKQIRIVVAELGTGLVLWSDVIDNLTAYKVREDGKHFHTMHISTDRTKIVGLAFDDEEAADGFGKKIERLTSDFSNISLSGAKVKKEKKKKVKKGKLVKPNKRDISQPCGFQHISTINKDSFQGESMQKNHSIPSEASESRPESSMSFSVE